MNKKEIHDYFSFTRQERRGVVVLCILIILCWCIPVVISYFRQGSQQDFSVFEYEVALFQQRQDSLNQEYFLQKHKRINLTTPGISNINELSEPFPFDPNTLSTEGWRKLGLPVKVTHTIENYRKAGGRFYKKEDLKKIYGLSPEMYLRLEPCINIAQKGQVKEGGEKQEDASHIRREANPLYVKSNGKDNNLILDVNSADSLQWIKLKGIGPALSSRILHFRKALGGFYSVEQIAEVYGLPDSTYQSIKQQLNISSFDLKKLNINTATVEELKLHPYINNRLASSIKAFRDQHGSFHSVGDLNQLQLVDDRIYRKLAPYLTVK